jgi:hypothetical protein
LQALKANYISKNVFCGIVEGLTVPLGEKWAQKEYFIGHEETFEKCIAFEPGSREPAAAIGIAAQGMIPAFPAPEVITLRGLRNKILAKEYIHYVYFAGFSRYALIGSGFGHNASAFGSANAKFATGQCQDEGEDQ